MFKIPDAKQVRRDGLDGSGSDSQVSIDEEIDKQLRERLRAKLASAFDFSFETPAPTPALEPTPAQIAPSKSGDVDMKDGGDNAEKEEAKEFEFRLFASGSIQPTKIVLEADNPVKLGEGTVLMPKRPLTYFLALRATGEELENFKDAAVSGDQVMAYAQQRWWGREMPWKIIACMPANSGLTSAKTKIVAQQEFPPVKLKRNRPCKKQRIKKHIKERALRTKKEEEEKKLKSREEYLRGKKRRINHLKKMRRKAKAQAEKAAKAAAVGLPPSVPEPDSEEDSPE